MEEGMHTEAQAEKTEAEIGLEAGHMQDPLTSDA
jgi:hypothetical protein